MNQIEKKKMMPSKEILHLAIEKARRLEAGQQIRVGGGEYSKSYWVFNVQGRLYIGSMADEPLGKFFTKRPVYQMLRKDGSVIGNIQQLIN